MDAFMGILHCQEYVLVVVDAISTMDGPTRVYATAASSSIPETSSSSSSTSSSVVVIDIAKEEEFDAVVAAHPGALVVLMCKAKGCRPCKQFKSKYDTLANYFTDAVFCEVIGDRNESTRNMMRKMKIRATPTFVFYRNEEKVHEHSGINPQKMIDALEAHVLEGETGYGEEHLHFVANVLSTTEDDEE
ncbi:Thioredoxin [Picochlorum sp. SENEW3]|nr:Thioredoxin [Picochlorum sp. SENEW3]WPT15746.1 Thioredoxin [Picochlorum sp. SENEW3]